MGEVWKARDTELDRDVAVKVSKAEFTARFKQEARTIAAFNHENICQIYDVGSNYIVMELIDGTPLKGPLPVETAAGAEFRRALVLISGSAVELAREPGTGAAIEERQASPQRLYRGHRLPGGAGTGEDHHSRTGEGFAVGTEPREPFRSRADWCGEELHRLRAGAEGVPRWILSVLYTRGGIVP
jgi:hypothetical protein